MLVELGTQGRDSNGPTGRSAHAEALAYGFAFAAETWPAPAFVDDDEEDDEEEPGMVSATRYR